MSLGLSIAHVGLHVRNIEEELEFLALIGGEMTSMDRMGNGNRIAFVSIDGDRHHNLALFEDGERMKNGDSRKQAQGIHHIAMPTESRESVDKWKEKLEAAGLTINGPSIQGPEGDGLTAGSGSYAIFFSTRTASVSKSMPARCRYRITVTCRQRANASSATPENVRKFDF